MFFLLEREGPDCVLYQASQVKALPGRAKAGKLDPVRLARVTGWGRWPGRTRRRRTPAACVPRVKEPGGKRKGRNAASRGNPCTGAWDALGEAAASVGRAQAFLSAKLRRLCRHRPREKARGAVS